MFGEQYPPPGYEPPELRAQLKSSTLILILMAAVINLLGGHQLWRVHRAERVGRDVTLALGIAGLVLINVVCIALIGYAQWGKE
jgi:hypothetical protein